MVIELGSHTDCRGSDLGQPVLSSRRGNLLLSMSRRELIMQTEYTEKDSERQIPNVLAQVAVEHLLRNNTS